MYKWTYLIAFFKVSELNLMQRDRSFLLFYQLLKDVLKYSYLKVNLHSFYISHLLYICSVHAIYFKVRNMTF
jgi:hypothetical protein